MSKFLTGFMNAVDCSQVAQCYTFSQSHSINEQYADVHSPYDFPNPWHIGVVKEEFGPYPPPDNLIQAELELLAHMYTMVLYLKPHLVVETGTNIGLMARALAWGCWANGFGKVVSSDTDPAMTAYARKVCRDPRLTPHLDIRDCPSLELPELREADLVFIDSSYESRAEEVKLVKPGAVYIYHDTFAEQDFRIPLNEAEGYVVHLDSPRGLSIVRKETLCV